MEDEIKALVKLKCGNMQEEIKYWLEKKYMSCVEMVRIVYIKGE